MLNQRECKMAMAKDRERRRRRRKWTNREKLLLKFRIIILWYDFFFILFRSLGSNNADIKPTNSKLYAMGALLLKLMIMPLPKFDFVIKIQFQKCYFSSMSNCNLNEVLTNFMALMLVCIFNSKRLS